MKREGSHWAQGLGLHSTNYCTRTRNYRLSPRCRSYYPRLALRRLRARKLNEPPAHQAVEQQLRRRQRCSVAADAVVVLQPGVQGAHSVYGHVAYVTPISGNNFYTEGSAYNYACVYNNWYYVDPNPAPNGYPRVSFIYGTTNGPTPVP